MHTLIEEADLEIRASNIYNGNNLSIFKRDTFPFIFSKIIFIKGLARC